MDMHQRNMSSFERKQWTTISQPFGFVPQPFNAFDATQVRSSSAAGGDRNEMKEKLDEMMVMWGLSDDQISMALIIMKEESH